MDTIGQFISDENYKYNQLDKTLCKEFYSDYVNYCKDNGISPYSQRRISDYLKMNNCRTEIGSGNKKFYFGIGKM